MVEIRKNCKVCGDKIISPRFRTYCSKICRTKATNKKHRKYQSAWQEKAYQKRLLKSGKELIPCLVCGKKYIQVGSHVVQVHGFESCREYREYFDLDVKRGVVPDWFRKIKGDQALENSTYLNLRKGRAYWFKPGDKKAGRYVRSHVTMERLRKGIRIK